MELGLRGTGRVVVIGVARRIDDGVHHCNQKVVYCDFYTVLRSILKDVPQEVEWLVIVFNNRRHVIELFKLKQDM
jgi:hypothetical protein